MDIFEYRENKKINMLLVEDEDILTKIYFNAFSREGYRVFISKNGKSAINKFDEQRIDIAILDLMLPDTSGMDVLRHIRASAYKTKVIVLTNILNSTMMRECAELGVNLYLLKSDYTPDQILERIKLVLSQESAFTITNK